MGISEIQTMQFGKLQSRPVLSCNIDHSHIILANGMWRALRMKFQQNGEREKDIEACSFFFLILICIMNDLY